MQRFPLPSLSITGLVLAIGLGTSASHSVANPLFGAAFYSSATGTGPFIAPYCVAIGDLNGDGHLDVAAGNYYAGTISLLLGDGSGSFAVTQLATGSNPYTVVIRDLNGDGKSDLVMTSGSATATVSVFLGNGNGSFGVRTDFGTGPYPHGLAIDDVNGDGRLDLVTANNPRTVSVLLGNGDGSFGAKHDFSTVDYAEGVVIGDLNGDGIPDLATQNYRGSGLPGTISVLIGNGDGSFGAANTSIGSWSDASNPASLAIGDLNGE